MKLQSLEIKECRNAQDFSEIKLINIKKKVL